MTLEPGTYDIQAYVPVADTSDNRRSLAMRLIDTAPDPDQVVGEVVSTDYQRGVSGFDDEAHIHAVWLSIIIAARRTVMLQGATLKAEDATPATLNTRAGGRIVVTKRQVGPKGDKGDAGDAGDAGAGRGFERVEVTGDMSLSGPAALNGKLFCSDGLAQRTITVTFANAAEVENFGNGEFVLKGGGIGRALNLRLVTSDLAGGEVELRTSRELVGRSDSTFIDVHDSVHCYFVGGRLLELIQHTENIGLTYSAGSITLKAGGGVSGIVGATPTRAGVMTAAQVQALESKVGGDLERVLLTRDITVTGPANMAGKMFVSDDTAELSLTLRFATAQDVIDFASNRFVIKAGRNFPVEVVFETTPCFQGDTTCGVS